MIHELIIHNIALIEELTISFEEGLNVISGETGAGKSILVNAISFILGGKIDVDMIRQGADKGSIQLIFHQKHTRPRIQNILRALSIETSDDILLRRELYTNGRTRNFINSTVVTNKDLQILGELLLDISSQHSHQSLIQSKNHLDILDNFAQLTGEKRSFTQYYKTYKELKRRHTALTRIEANKATQKHTAEHAIQEIEAAKLIPDEDRTLEDEIRQLSHFETLLSSTTEIYNTLYNKDKSIMSSTENILKILQGIHDFDSRFTQPQKDIQEALYLLENAKDFFREYTNNLEYSPQTLAQLEQRLDIIQKLKRKYGPSIADILTHKSLCKKQLEQFDQNIQKLEVLANNIKQLTQKLETAGLELSKKRKEKAQDFSTRIATELEELAMTKTVFQISFTSPDSDDSLIINDQTLQINEHGFDKVEFLFSANLGEPPKSLHKIASGGELSRFMLAIKKILTDTDHIETLLFDEVDTGIGGEVLFKVAEKLKHIAKKHQVICITHAAQIASQAEHHYHIQKYEQDNRVKTRIRKLNKAESTQEIARMMSGDSLTDTSIQHAKEIMNKMNKVRETH